MSLHYVDLASRGLIMHLRRMIRWGGFACTGGMFICLMWVFKGPLTAMNIYIGGPDNQMGQLYFNNNGPENFLLNPLLFTDPDSIGNGEPYPGYDTLCVDTDPPPNCNSNDFVFLSAYLASDTLGNLLTDCQEGIASQAYLCLTFNKSNASGRRGFYISTSITDGNSSLYYVNQCFDQTFSSSGEFTLCIPDELITFTCGTQLKILDTYFAWGSSNAASNICNRTNGCASPKCDFFEGETTLISPLLANFDYEITCPGVDTIEAVQFTDLTVGGSTNYTYLWDFDDGSTSIEANPVHIYNSTGIYSVELIVSDSIGISDTIVSNVMIDSCSAIFCQISGNLTICEGDSLVLVEDIGWAEEWSWYSPNGFIDSTAQLIAYPTSLSDSGYYKVVVANALGDLDSCQVIVNVITVYVDTISYIGCSGDGYTIMVGDSTFNEANPLGTIILNTANGCDSTFVVNLQYNPQVVVDAGMLPSPACSNIPIELSDLGPSISGGTTTGKWTTMGSGTFDNDGDFGGPLPATVYTPSTTDIDNDQVILTLTSDDPPGSCEPEANPALIIINDLRCSEFPFTGN